MATLIDRILHIGNREFDDPRATLAGWLLELSLGVDLFDGCADGETQGRQRKQVRHRVQRDEG
jgi:hypothetical protein